jgi:hypothetical protein
MPALHSSQSAFGHWASISAYLTQAPNAGSTALGAAAPASSLSRLGFADLLEGTASGAVSPSTNVQARTSPAADGGSPGANQAESPSLTRYAAPGLVQRANTPGDQGQAAYRYNAMQASLLDLGPGLA